MDKHMVCKTPALSRRIRKTIDEAGKKAHRNRKESGAKDRLKSGALQGGHAAAKKEVRVLGKEKQENDTSKIKAKTS